MQINSIQIYKMTYVREHSFLRGRKTSVDTRRHLFYERPVPMTQKIVLPRAHILFQNYQILAGITLLYSLISMQVLNNDIMCAQL